MHILLNYEWDSKALLSLVLVGLSDFEDRLRLRRNRSLYSRLHHRFALDPLGAEDTADYVRMRMKKAGCQREVFAADAISVMQEATAGALRDIDRIASLSLRAAARKNRKTVERDVVSRIVKATASAHANA